MKTAILVPDDLFERAAKFAEREKISRSTLFSKALEDYLDRHESDSITENLNAVYRSRASSIDPVLYRTALASLPQEDW
jgi:predicted transcriptional regulator